LKDYKKILDNGGVLMNPSRGDKEVFLFVHKGTQYSSSPKRRKKYSLDDCCWEEMHFKNKFERFIFRYVNLFVGPFHRLS
jgi:hypothetical protein